MIRKADSSIYDFEGLSGAEIVGPGLDDLAAGVVSPEALAVALFAPRLRPLGVSVPDCPLPSPQTHALYTLLEDRYGNEAHSRYNPLLRRVISFAAASNARPQPPRRGTRQRVLQTNHQLDF